MNEQKEKIKGLLMQAYKDLAIDPKDLDTDLIEDFPDEFMYFIGLVEAAAVLAEREACAKLLDQMSDDYLDDKQLAKSNTATRCAAAIRKRTEWLSTANRGRTR